MNADEIFFDTNILLYLFSQDDAKAKQAEALVASGLKKVLRSEIRLFSRINTRDDFDSIRLNSWAWRRQ